MPFSWEKVDIEGDRIPEESNILKIKRKESFMDFIKDERKWLDLIFDKMNKLW